MESTLSSQSDQLANIFISYRRDDSPVHVGRLSDSLVSRFGRNHIFMDKEAIEPGSDYFEVIERAVSSCDVLIAVIGKNWLTEPDGSARKLDDPNDLVNFEISVALKRGIKVIPLLVQGAAMPGPEDLPDSLKKFARRQALEINDSYWRVGVDHLVSAVEEVLNDRLLKSYQNKSPISRVLSLYKPRTRSGRAFAILFCVCVAWLFILTTMFFLDENNELSLNAFRTTLSELWHLYIVPSLMLIITLCLAVYYEKKGEQKRPL